VRVILDECVNRKLARELGGHDLRTVRQMGWSGVKNGALLLVSVRDRQDANQPND
jgi:hypothetical protein